MVLWDELSSGAPATTEESPSLHGRSTIAVASLRRFQSRCFIEGADRTQATLLPETIDDYVVEDKP